MPSYFNHSNKDWFFKLCSSWKRWARIVYVTEKRLRMCTHVKIRKPCCTTTREIVHIHWIFVCCCVSCALSASRYLLSDTYPSHLFQMNCLNWQHASLQKKNVIVKAKCSTRCFFFTFFFHYPHQTTVRTVHTWRTNKQASIRILIFKKALFLLLLDNWVTLYFAVSLLHILHVLSIFVWCIITSN